MTGGVLRRGAMRRGCCRRKRATPCALVHHRAVVIVVVRGSGASMRAARLAMVPVGRASGAVSPCGGGHGHQTRRVKWRRLARGLRRGVLKELDRVVIHGKERRIGAAPGGGRRVCRGGGRGRGG